MARKNSDSSYHTAGDNVYTFLRSSILDVKIKPGEVINVKELSEFLSVSRSPVRDAVIQLEREGLVETVPKTGTFVSKIDIDRVRDERFLRACLEEKLAVEFTRIYTDKQIDMMKTAIEHQTRLVKDSGDPREFLHWDDAFHAVFFHATGHPHCLNITQNMSGHYDRIRLLSLVDMDVRIQSLEAHERILGYILTNKTEELAKTLHLHITEKNSEENSLKRKFPELFSNTDVSSDHDYSIWSSDYLSGF